ncbi:sensor histidine kinase [Ruminococcus sp.]|uniref:sensor histidine kinase n=1 Tax=Ruminococcus sp. TaxID=41978 RepID=UPI00388E6212
MMDWTTYFSAVIDLTTLLLGVLGILITFILRDTESQWRKFCIVFFSAMILKTAAALIGQLAALYWKNIPLQTACDFLGVLFSSTIIPLLTLYILRCCSQEPRKSFLWKLILSLWGLSAAAAVGDLLQRTLLPGGIEQKRWLILVYLLFTAISLIVSLIAVIRRRKQLSKLQFILILVYLLAPVSIMLLAMELMLFIDQGKRYLKQKEELANQKASLAVLQMRPHFIYNTMTSIYYLIEQDAPKAQQVTLDFTDYLRKNFTAIAKEGTIPFAEELEHTRAYLAVEQVRFEGKLFVEFDAPYTSFRLPPLTLQPIVENAVKHGVDPDLDPLTIRIQTREVKNGVEITVADTGPGFGVKDNDEPHIALANIRERLEMMCKGTLTVSEREGGGTVVSIFVSQKHD